MIEINCTMYSKTQKNTDKTNKIRQYGRSIDHKSKLNSASL